MTDGLWNTFSESEWVNKNGESVHEDIRGSNHIAHALDLLDAPGLERRD